MRERERERERENKMCVVMCCGVWGMEAGK